MKRLIVTLCVVGFIFSTINLFAFSTPPEPPGQSSTGYGSNANYIASGYTEHSFGSILSGTKCYYYVPNVLKNGDSAPVVILLHGMILLAPEIYEAHIEHLCKQGYIVVFPQFQKTILSLLGDMDQEDWLNRAIDASNGALSRLGSRVEEDNITLYGHSLGGLLALTWSSVQNSEREAPLPRNIVMANPSVEMSAAMPVPIPGMDWLMNLFIDQLDYEEMAQSTTCPVIILTGDDDSIAPPWTVAQNAYNSLVNAESRVVFEFFTDDHGDPELKGDHMASISDDGWMPSWMMTFIGGDGEVDAVDYRYYWAALDAVLAGDMDPDFDMGIWSDGDAVNEVDQVRP